MPIVSYAQNFEDVMLWRALKNTKCGFYIDVGANDPDEDSVTKLFYDQGWRGINIEPIMQWFEKLQYKRPRDINLQVAAGAKNCEVVIYDLPDTGLSTIDKATAKRHQVECGLKSIEISVPVETLNEICQRFHVKQIHFLKIDVEGFETDVLLGIDFSVVRPWIVLVESTLPNTQVEIYENWEPILLNAGYEFVYFDGLNRYYIAQEHCEIKACFLTPPNVFDHFITNRTHQAENTLIAMQNTLSWRLTAPLRKVKKELHLAKERKLIPTRTSVFNLLHDYINTFKRIVKSLLRQVGLWVLHRQKLKRLVIMSINFIPGLSYRLRQIITPLKSEFGSSYTVSKSCDLSPRAITIYNELKQAIATNKNNGMP